MISTLHIRNIGIIEDLSIDLNKGLNVLTGETGAGKTLIIDSLQIISGGRFSKDMIRKGETNSFVELCMYEPENENSIDGNIIISREIQSNGKNMCKINGRMVTVNELKEFMSKFIEIHGQNDNQNLLDSKQHLQYLDGFIGNKFINEKEEYKKLYNRYNEVKQELKENYGDDKERQRKLDLLKYQVNEIDEANLKIDEEIELEEKRKVMMNSEKIVENLQEADAFIALTGRDEENVLTSLFAINNNVKNVITKVTRFNYNVIAKNVGIDTIISPKAITANKILKYIRFLKNKKKCCIENIYKIFDEQAEAIEFLVREDVKFLNRKLKDINIINDIIIATIVRNDKIIIPSGDDKIELGDRVIIITKRDKLVDINDIVVRGNK